MLKPRVKDVSKFVLYIFLISSKVSVNSTSKDLVDNMVMELSPVFLTCLCKKNPIWDLAIHLRELKELDRVLPEE